MNDFLFLDFFLFGGRKRNKGYSFGFEEIYKKKEVFGFLVWAAYIFLAFNNKCLTLIF